MTIKYLRRNIKISSSSHCIGILNYFIVPQCSVGTKGGIIMTNATQEKTVSNSKDKNKRNIAIIAGISFIFMLMLISITNFSNHGDNKKDRIRETATNVTETSTAVVKKKTSKTSSKPATTYSYGISNSTAANTSRNTNNTVTEKTTKAAPAKKAAKVVKKAASKKTVKKKTSTKKSPSKKAVTTKKATTQSVAEETKAPATDNITVKPQDEQPTTVVNTTGGSHSAEADADHQAVADEDIIISY